jgi:hypothetical protein
MADTFADVGGSCSPFAQTFSGLTLGGGIFCGAAGCTVGDTGGAAVVTDP